MLLVHLASKVLTENAVQELEKAVDCKYVAVEAYTALHQVRECLHLAYGSALRLGTSGSLLGLAASQIPDQGWCCSSSLCWLGRVLARWAR